MQLIPNLFPVYINKGFFSHLKPKNAINLKSPAYIPKNYPVKDDSGVLLL